MPCNKFTDVLFGKRKIEDSNGNGNSNGNSNNKPKRALDLRTVVIIEWKAKLDSEEKEVDEASDNSSTVFNTIRGLATMDARNAAARHAQWGFMFCRAAPPQRGDAVMARGIRIKASGWEKGVPRIFVKTIK